MAINGVTYGTSSVLNQSVLNLKNQLTTLQAQLTTGQKSTTYAGMGTAEGFAIAARGAPVDGCPATSDSAATIQIHPSPASEDPSATHQTAAKADSPIPPHYRCQLHT